jgi:hypothetical protein
VPTNNTPTGPAAPVQHLSNPHHSHTTPNQRPSPQTVKVWPVQHRPLALVSVLAVGDYLLWNWSLQGNHDVLALISGLTLVLLAIALIWLVALNVGRLLAGAAQRRGARSRGAHRTTAAKRSGARPARSDRGVPVGAAAQTAEMTAQQQQRQGGEPASSSKLAA